MGLWRSLLAFKGICRGSAISYLNRPFLINSNFFVNSKRLRQRCLSILPLEGLEKDFGYNNLVKYRENLSIYISKDNNISLFGGIFDLL